MTITRNPKRNTATVSDEKAMAFISGAEKGTSQAAQAAPPDLEQNKKPIMIRVDPSLLDRIDRAAKRLGISRSAFIVSSSAIRVEEME
jgi:predicted HicB family RNase H-like nuclease